VKLVILSCALCLPVLADVAAGLEALKNGDFATALKEFSLSANQGDAVAEFNLAWMYDTAQGVPQAYAEAVR